MRSGFLSCSLLALVVAPVAAGDETFFTGLGELPGGRFASAARSVTVIEVPDPEDEDAVIEQIIVVGAAPSAASGPNVFEAVVWIEEDGAVGLGSVFGGTFQSGANGISLDGSVIVGASSSENTGANSVEAILLDEEGALALGDLTGGSLRSEAFAVSAEGDVVVGASSSASSGTNADEAFVWTEEDGLQGLGDLAGGSFNGQAFGVSGLGDVIVGASSSGSSGTDASEGFVWTKEDGMVGLGDLPGGRFFSAAHAISAYGDVIVGSSSSAASGSNAFEACVWTEEEGVVEIAGLGDLPDGLFRSQANGVSADGSVIVGGGNASFGDAAFIWTEEEGMRLLQAEIEDEGVDLTGWILTTATAISGDGITIVGDGRNPSGLAEAWLVRLPEPARGLQVGASLLAVALLRHRRRPHRSR